MTTLRQIELCCPICRHSFQSQAVEVSPLVKEHVLNELAPRAPSGTSGSAKYEAAAKVAEWQGVEPRQIADLLRQHWILAAADQQRTDPQE